VRVYGVEIPQSAIDAAVVRMREGRPFTATLIESVLRSNGVPNVGRDYYGCVSYRAADRIIQQQRRMGNIKYDGKVWRWVRDEQARTADLIDKEGPE
jgi:hypothetical protein